MFWQVEYDSAWNPICEICWKSFKKLWAHTFMKHNLTAREYKILYWLDVKKGILCEETRNICRENNAKYFNKVVKENLLSKWQSSRFIKWQHRKKYTS